MNKGMKVGKHDHVRTIKYSSVVEVQGNTEGKQHTLRPERQLITEILECSTRGFNILGRPKERPKVSE